MLLFLHGFLGQKEDWDPLFEALSSTIKVKAIDLPGHGGAPRCEDIALAVKQQIKSAKIVIGYSAGGRLALELKERFPNDYDQIIAISTHPGLEKEEEKQTRLQIDEKWIKMLREDPFEHFLENWYAQEIFHPLIKNSKFDQILKRRKKQDPQSLAWFLEKFSIAKKKTPEIHQSTIFIYGQEDLNMQNYIVN